MGIRTVKTTDTVQALGRSGLCWIRGLGNAGIFGASTLFFTFSTPWKAGRILRRIQFIGFQSILVVALTGAFTGMVLSLQGYYALSRFGSDAFLGPLVGLSLVRELGPVISALMVTGRAGSAVTAEIGIMRNGEQIDAMILMGVNPYRYLMVPTLVAALISLPLLGVLFNTVGIAGGYLVGVELLGVNGGTYMGEMTTYVDMADIRAGLYKSVSFGAIIAWICTYKGYTTSFGAEGVSKATTEAVVLASVMILVWDFFMTSVLF